VTAVFKAQGRRDAAGGQGSKETAVLSSATKGLGGVERLTNRSRHTRQRRQRTSEGTPGQTTGNQVSSQLRPIEIARGSATHAQVVPVVQLIVGVVVTLVVPIPKSSISARLGVPTKVPPLSCHQRATLVPMS